MCVHVVCVCVSVCVCVWVGIIFHECSCLGGSEALFVQRLQSLCLILKFTMT